MSGRRTGIPHGQFLKDGLPQGAIWSWRRWRTTAPGMEFIERGPELLVERLMECKNSARRDAEIAVQRVAVAGVRRRGKA